MEGLLRLIIIYLTDTFKFLAKVTLALTVGLGLLHQLPQIHRTDSAIIIAAKKGTALQSMTGLSANWQWPIKSAGFAPGEDPAEWLKKFMQRVQQAREEVRRKAMEQLRKQRNRSSAQTVFDNVPEERKSSRAFRRSSVRRTAYTSSKPRRIRQRPIEEGIASFYGKRWNGRKTANGEIFNDEKYTAAHKTLPFGTFVRVVRKDNGRSVVVRINDRGPFKPGRIIDLSTAGARKLGMLEEGLVQVAIYPATLVDFLKQFERRN